MTPARVNPCHSQMRVVLGSFEGRAGILLAVVAGVPPQPGPVPHDANALF